MPLYEFQCKTCNQSFEAIVASSDETKYVDCPNCGSSEIKKLISSPNLRVVSGGSSSQIPTSSGCKPGSGFS